MWAMSVYYRRRHHYEKEYYEYLIECIYRYIYMYSIRLKCYFIGDKKKLVFIVQSVYKTFYKNYYYQSSYWDNDSDYIESHELRK